MLPQARDGSFSTQLFDRYQRSEKALLSSLMERYVPGVSTRKVKRIMQELCGSEVSSSTISHLVKGLDEEIRYFRNRKLGGGYLYLIVDARYEKVRVNRRVISLGVLMAIGIHQDGFREVLGFELARRGRIAGGFSWGSYLIEGLQGCNWWYPMIIWD